MLYTLVFTDFRGDIDLPRKGKIAGKLVVDDVQHRLRLSGKRRIHGTDERRFVRHRVETVAEQTEFLRYGDVARAQEGEGFAGGRVAAYEKRGEIRLELPFQKLPGLAAGIDSAPDVRVEHRHFAAEGPGAQQQRVEHGGQRIIKKINVTIWIRML